MSWLSKLFGVHREITTVAASAASEWKTYVQPEIHRVCGAATQAGTACKIEVARGYAHCSRHGGKNAPPKAASRQAGPAAGRQAGQAQAPGQGAGQAAKTLGRPGAEPRS